MRWMCLLLLLAVAACSTGRPVAVAPSCAQVGLASWYRPSLHRAADGDHYGPDALIAAHRNLPFGTRVRVTDLESGRSVIVRIGDRGPFVAGRIIDLSPAAARQLGMRHDGVVTVRLELTSGPPAAGACPFRSPGSV